MKRSGSAECQTMIVHDDIVDRVASTLPDEESLIDLGDFFKIFGDTTRIKILHALSISEMCVCDLSAVIGASQSAVSHQLKSLRQASLVKFRREGKTVFYSLKDDHVNQIIKIGLIHIKE